MSDAEKFSQMNNSSDESEEHIIFPREALSFDDRIKRSSADRVLMLAFRNDDGTLSKSEILMENLVEVCVVERSGTRNRFLGHMQLEGYPREKYDQPIRSEVSKIEKARQYALGLINTEVLITADSVLKAVKGIERSDAVKALVQLARDGKLARVGHGVYGHPDRPKPSKEEIERHRGRKGRPINRK